MLMKLREQILAEASAPTEDELLAFYEEHKHRFRSPPHAQLEEILLETPSEARQLAAQIEAGAEWSELARAHSRAPQRRRWSPVRLPVTGSLFWGRLG